MLPTLMEYKVITNTDPVAFEAACNAAITIEGFTGGWGGLIVTSVIDSTDTITNLYSQAFIKQSAEVSSEADKALTYAAAAAEDALFRMRATCGLV